MSSFFAYLIPDYLWFHSTEDQKQGWMNIQGSEVPCGQILLTIYFWANYELTINLLFIFTIDGTLWFKLVFLGHSYSNITHFICYWTGLGNYWYHWQAPNEAEVEQGPFGTEEVGAVYVLLQEYSKYQCKRSCFFFVFICFLNMCFEGFSFHLLFCYCFIDILLHAQRETSFR